MDQYSAEFINYKQVQQLSLHNAVRMKFNKNQKRTLFIGLLVIAAALLVWIGFGGEIFTKSQILIEKQDEFLGTKYKEWKEQFILGLDYTLGFSGIIAMFTAFFVWRQRTK